MSETLWVVTRHGMVVASFPNENAAWAGLHRLQPHSWEHATKYEGWAVQPIKLVAQ